MGMYGPDFYESCHPRGGTLPCPHDGAGCPYDDCVRDDSGGWKTWKCHKREYRRVREADAQKRADMTKKRTPEQEAISRAKKMPERKGFIGRRMAWGQGGRPFKWGFWTNWSGFSLSIGEMEGVTEKETAPQPKFLIAVDRRPFGCSIYWYKKHIVWIGDWEWKRLV